MNTEVSFLTPIVFQNPEKNFSQVSLERISAYFYLGGKRAYVIDNKSDSKDQSVLLVYPQKNIKQVLLIAAKILSFATVIIPLIMLTLLKIARSPYKFSLSAPVAPPQAPAGILPSHDSSTYIVKNLMDKYTKAWQPPQNGEEGYFKFEEEFDLKSFTHFLQKQAQIFKRPFDAEQNFGFIEKFDLDSSTDAQIFVRADLHGDLKSLIENLRALQKKGLLDENYRCQKGVQLVFLGDYCDRGWYGTQILELLLQLRQENPQQIHLIRGNHEDTFINEHYGATDIRLTKVIRNKESSAALNEVYETMPLSVYLSIEGEQREYVQFTHGLFEPSFDPSTLLDQRQSGDYVAIPKHRLMSERVTQISNNPSHRLYQSAQRITEIVKNTIHSEASRKYTLYNWADVNYENTESDLGNFLQRGNYQLNAQDIKHYLELSSDDHKVRTIFRGHQHEFKELPFEDELIVSTLPVGIDSPPYRTANAFDKAYILDLKKWKKKPILRKMGGEACLVVKEQPLLEKDAI